MCASSMVESIKEYTLQIILQVVLLLQDPIKLICPELLCEGREGGLADSF